MKLKSRTKQRIGHIYHGARPVQAKEGWDSVPRGWIQPDGKFRKTKQHWISISGYLGKKRSKEPEAGERHAHEAYSHGWISIGHGGTCNAVGHKKTFESFNHPAVATLRKLVSGIPHFSLRVEKQSGKLNSETGRHEDFDIREYDLDFFIRRGRLRKAP